MVYCTVESLFEHPVVTVVGMLWDCRAAYLGCVEVDHALDEVRGRPCPRLSRSSASLHQPSLSSVVFQEIGRRSNMRLASAMSSRETARYLPGSWTKVWTHSLQKRIKR